LADSVARLVQARNGMQAEIERLRDAVRAYLSRPAAPPETPQYRVRAVDECVLQIRGHLKILLSLPEVHGHDLRRMGAIERWGELLLSDVALIAPRTDDAPEAQRSAADVAEDVLAFCRELLASNPDANEPWLKGIWRVMQGVMDNEHFGAAARARGAGKDDEQ